MITTSTMSTALPQPPRADVARCVESGQFGNNSEYVRELTLGISGSRTWPGCGPSGATRWRFGIEVCRFGRNMRQMNRS